MISTIAYAALYLLLRDRSVRTARTRSRLALTAVANTQANRRFTFGVQGRAGTLRHQSTGAVAYLLALVSRAGRLTSCPAIAALCGA